MASPTFCRLHLFPAAQNQKARFFTAGRGENGEPNSWYAHPISFVCFSSPSTCAPRTRSKAIKQARQQNTYQIQREEETVGTADFEERLLPSTSEAWAHPMHRTSIPRAPDVDRSDNYFPGFDERKITIERHGPTTSPRRRKPVSPWLRRFLPPAKPQRSPGPLLSALRFATGHQRP